MSAVNRLDSMQRHERTKTLALAFFVAVCVVAMAAWVAGSGS